MQIKLLAIALFVVSCGQNISLKENSLTNIDPLTDEQAKKYEKAGVITKGEPTKVLYQGRELIVSKFSSKSAELFIQTLSPGTPVPIYFTGGVQGNDIVIEAIRRQ